MENDQNEIIKTFLKIDSPKFQDKPYYSINKEKNILTIFDPVDKGPSDIYMKKYVKIQLKKVSMGLPFHLFHMEIQIVIK